MIGLGVMGENLALNIEEHGFPVAVWNLEGEWVDRFVNKNSGKKITGTKTFADFTKALTRPRRIMMMIKAGPPVDSARIVAAVRLVNLRIGVDREPAHLGTRGAQQMQLGLRLGA